MRVKRSSVLMTLLLLVMVVYSTVTLVNLQAQLREKEIEEEELSTQIALEKQENMRIQQDINLLNTEAGVEKVARENLGYAKPGEKIFYIEE